MNSQNSSSDTNKQRTSAAVLLAAALRQVLPEAEVLSLGPSRLGFYCDMHIPAGAEETLLEITADRMHLLQREAIDYRETEMVGSNAADYLKATGSVNQSLDAMDVGAALCAVAIVDEKPLLLPALGQGDLDVGVVALIELEQLATERCYRFHGVVEANKQLLKQTLKRIRKGRKLDHRALAEQRKLVQWSVAGPVWLPSGVALRRDLLDFVCTHLESVGILAYEVPESMQLSDVLSEQASGYTVQCHEAAEGELPSGLLATEHYTVDEAVIRTVHANVAAELQRGLQCIGEFLTISPFKTTVELRASRKKSGVYKEQLRFLEQAADAADLGAVETVECAADPALVFLVEDAIGRRWELSRLSLPLRELQRLKKENLDASAKEVEACMVKLSLMGSLERWIGLLLEVDPNWRPPSKESRKR